MSRKAGLMQRIDGLIAGLLRRLDTAAGFLIASSPARRDVLLRPVPVRVDAARNRRQRIGAAYRG
jgi:hypothetical protein